MSAAATPDPIDESRRQWIAHGWTDVADGMTLVTSLMRAHQIMLARVDAVLRPFKLTFARYELLMLLSFSKTGALPMSKASERLQVHPTSTTNAVDRLEAAGLVQRLPHPRDGRTTLVKITDAGRSLAAEATDDLNQVVFGEPGLEGDSLSTLLELLADLRSAKPSRLKGSES
ncbi:MarR family transcriptional regulator [Saxibacter everestensis]|uniref:MarR family transcriptional regulator n=1 Tax=Saxibacter everestensis TaxID=2909229 RepID=A0ABY8QPH4_9MICO|nr:MarR family transcriptional regulator [Brevibacteriaceae bacterium ZFBP1038]